MLHEVLEHSAVQLGVQRGALVLGATSSLGQKIVPSVKSIGSTIWHTYDQVNL